MEGSTMSDSTPRFCVLSPFGRKNCWTVIFKAPRLGGSGSAEELAQIPQALHGSLAVRGFITHDQTALVVLHGAGQNLAGTRTELARQHHQRPVPRGTRRRRRCARRRGC